MRARSGSSLGREALSNLAANHSQDSTTIGQPQSYANVLRTSAQRDVDTSDPLTRIRNLGTQGNQEQGVRNTPEPSGFSFLKLGQW